MGEGMNSSQDRDYEQAKEKAEELEGTQVLDALTEANEKAQKNRGKIQNILDDLMTLMRLVKAYWTGDYRQIPWTALISITGAVLYFLNPVDAIPDFIAGVGYVDDASVIGIVLSSFGHEIEEFQKWERSQEEAIPVAVVVEN